MSPKRVVYCKGADPFDVYVGRGNGSIWGNPWTHKFGTQAPFIVKSRKLAVENFEKWLRGTDFVDVLPNDRRRILDSLPSLAGKILACWCEEGQLCHAQVLVKLSDETSRATDSPEAV